MSLQLILGPSGSGKSTLAIRRILAHAKDHPSQSHIVFVPEQFTLQTQRAVVLQSEHHAICNVEVLSFERFAYRVYDECGVMLSDVLEDTGKSLLLRRICLRHKKDLPVLSKNMDRSGFIDELKSLLSEWMLYDISPEDVRGFTKLPSMGPHFSAKANELAFLYETFLSTLKESFITAEQLLEPLIKVCGRSSLLKNAYLTFDGYTGFTPLQNKLLAEFFDAGEHIEVTGTFDVRESLHSPVQDHELFSMTKRMAKKLCAIAEECGAAIEDPILLKTAADRRFIKDGKLSHLEKNLFRKSQKAFSGNGAPDLIRIYCLDDPRSELIFTAASIRDLVTQNKNVRYRDIAVLSAGLEEYRHHAKRIFDDYDIPLFLDAKENLGFHPLTELLSAILSIFDLDFSYEAVMRYLKTGLLPFSFDEIDRFDNYLFATGLSGAGAYKKGFTYLPEKTDAEALSAINDLREKLAEPFFAHGFPKKAKAGEYAKLLYAILSDIGIEDSVQKLIASLEEEGDSAAAAQTEGLYAKIISLFDKIHDLMGEEECDISSFREIFEEGLSSLSVGIIPPNTDAVTFGDIERTRLDEIKHLFLIGASDALIPKRPSGGGLLSQAERERLREAEITLAPTEREQVFHQRFYLYLMLTKPSLGLVITTPNVSSSGDALRPSYLCGILCRLFPSLSVKRIDADELLSVSLTPKRLLTHVAERLRDAAAGEKAADDLPASFALLRETAPDTAKELLSNAFYSYEPAKLQPDTAQRITGAPLLLSASRLERFASCSYSYFLRYELSLTERREAGVTPADLGNLYHASLERYAKSVAETGADWFSLSDEESIRLLNAAVEESIRTMTNVGAFSKNREGYILFRVKRTLNRTVWALKNHIQTGRFVPSRFELPLSALSAGTSYELSDGRTMKLSGIIDRVDTARLEGNTYYKVIDYKSGDKDLDLGAFYAGTQSQLFLYMKALLDSGKTAGEPVYPGAVLYAHIDDPLIGISGPEPKEKIEEKRLLEFKNKGYISTDDRVVGALDPAIIAAKDEGRNVTSRLYPLNMKKDGNFGAASRVFTPEEFERAVDFAGESAAETGNAIISGIRNVSPGRQGEKDDACRFCPYHAVCGFDPRLSGFSYREIPAKLSKDEFFARLDEREGITKTENDA